MNIEKRDLILSFMDYLIERDMKPFFCVNLAFDVPGLPDALLKQDHVILNMSRSATGKVSAPPSEYIVDMRFDGVPTTVYIPWDAVEVVYAPDNSGPKLIFGPPEKPPTAANKPTLRIVK